MDRNPLIDPLLNYHDSGINAYESIFPSRESPVLLEATTHYLYQQTALDVVPTLSTKPSVLVMMREPASRIYSLYRYLKYTQASIAPTVVFADFVSYAQSQHVPSIKKHSYSKRAAYVWENAINHSTYVKYVPAWVNQLGKEKVFLYTFEQMRANSRSFMLQVASDFGLKTEPFMDIKLDAQNVSVRPRNLPAHRFIRKLKEFTPKTLRFSIFGRIYRGTMLQSATPLMSESEIECLDRLKTYFDDSNRQLADVYGLDTSIWS